MSKRKATSAEARKKFEADRKARQKAEKLSAQPQESRENCEAHTGRIKPNAFLDSPVIPAPEVVAPEVRPGNTPPANPQPAPLSAASCQNCLEMSARLARKLAEIARLDALVIAQAADLARERAEVSRLSAVLASTTTQEQQPAAAAPTTGKTPPPAAPKVSKDDAAALAARVVAAKVERINSYSRGHVIGSARV